MHNVSIPQGWADALEPGDTVIVRSYGSGVGAYIERAVESVTATEVRVAGRSFRRGKGRSKLIEYQNEGAEIPRINTGGGQRIYPLTPETKAWLRRERAAATRETNAIRLRDNVVTAARTAFNHGHTGRLRKALTILEGPTDVG